MSSVVTAVPSGSVKEWCIQAPSWGFSNPPVLQECANATRGTYPSDFETICCDGNIVDTSKDLYHSGRGQTVDLEDLVCCRLQGEQQGGIMPLYTGPGNECSTGTPVPLASLAATNTRNVQNFLVTYTSASFGSHTTADYIPTKTPYCLWAYTASGVAMTNITVAAAEITTLGSSSSYLGATMGSLSSTNSSTRTSSSAAAGQSSTSASSVSRITFKKLSSLVLLLSGVVMFGQFL
jgi:hypothetical protein